jgi:hypothetical protein
MVGLAMTDSIKTWSHLSLVAASLGIRGLRQPSLIRVSMTDLNEHILREFQTSLSRQSAVSEMIRQQFGLMTSTQMPGQFA